uniref:Uncharacterized protein n=1 Tax=Tanacetum cinerariifolium TaxID=118510 RepID=A0A6L2JA87_TANCI|nr:hypothetical protein [Tanacetum cinerariifolium]
MGLDSGSTPLIDATVTIHMGTGSASNSRNGGNGSGDSKNVGQTRSNSTSDGVMLISTLNSGKSSWYANVTSKPCRTKVNFRTLFTPTGNEIDVVVPVESIRAITERFANTTYVFFLARLLGYSLYNLAIWMVKVSINHINIEFVYRIEERKDGGGV